MKIRVGENLNILDLIDTRQGTNNANSYSNGNTLPYTTIPFGMNAFVPQTRQDVRFFNPHDKTTLGVRLTHQPSPWMGDYAFILFNIFGLTDEEAKCITETDSPELITKLSQSSFNPEYATFKPHYLSYKRLRDSVNLELIPSTYGASIKADSANNTYITLSIAETGCLEVSKDGSVLSGYTDQLSGSKYGNFRMYFKIKSKNSEFHSIKRIKYFEDEHAMEMYWLELMGTQPGMTLEFDIVTSYIDLEQAETNYAKEKFFSMTWEDKKKSTGKKWLKYLEKIEVEHSNFDLVKTFYTSLYRTATFPQRAYEITNEDEIVHYSPYTGRRENGYYYLNNGYWDTFRTNYPLYAIVIPDYLPRFIEGILNISKEDKYLPKWLSPDERGLMPGTLVDAVIADATVKGLISREVSEELLEAMIYTATVPSENELEGREDGEFYFKNGYIPSETHESVNKTLDYAYSDFCIAQVAKSLGREELANKYYLTSLNYRNLFDPKSRLMKPKDAKGNFIEKIKNHRWGDHYTEGSAWQNSLSVFHNVNDLIKLYGGDQAFYEHLEELVNMEAIFDTGGYGQEIHEMSEMAMLQFGQLAISNQPSFHLPYLFVYAGYPNISQIVIKQLLMNAFDNSFDGYPGDEDNGSLSSWFILSSLGLYAVTPGTEEYVLGISIWNNAKVKLNNGNTISIKSDFHEPYLNVVTGRKINNEKYEKDFLLYDDLMQGIKIEQKLGVVPSLNPTGSDKRPFSLNQLGK